MPKQFIVLLTVALLTPIALAETYIETVNVTAQRLSQDNYDSSITHLKDYTDMQPSHISEVLNQAPGIWVSRGNGQEHLTALRSPVFVGAGGCGPFLMTEDNVSLRSPAFCNVNQLFESFYEMAERIEVLRGTGTAMHGSNAMHGIFNIVSPEFRTEKETTVGLDLQASHNYTRAQVDHRTDNLIAQFSAADDNGYKEDSGYDLYKTRLKYRHEKDDWEFQHNITYINLDQETATYVVGKDAYKDDKRLDENPNPEAYRKAESFRYSSNISFVPEEGKTLLLTPYVRSNDMEFLMHFQPGTPVEESGHDSIGIQSSFHRPYNDKVDLVTGFDLDYTSGYLHQYQNKDIGLDIFPQGDHYDYTVDVITTAIFLHADTYPTEFLTLSGGTRLEYARYDYNNRLSDSEQCASPCRYINPDDDAINFYNWSPKLAAIFQFEPTHQFFLKAAKAYRAPQTNELFRLEQGQNVAKIDSEEIISSEIGVIGDITDIFQYQISLYDMNKDNVIFKDANRQNVDDQKTKHKGIELSLNLIINDYLNFKGNFSYAKHQYDSNIALFNTTSGSIKGNIIDTAPRHLHNVQMIINADTRTSLTLEAVYVGSYYLDPENTFSYPGHTIGNFRYSRQIDTGWKLDFGITNISNEYYADRADITVRTFANPVAQERYFIGEPRSFRVGLSKTY